MMYLLGLCLSTITGYLAVRLIARQRLDATLRWLLGMALGLGISGLTVFYVQLCFGFYQPWAPASATVIMAAGLLYLNRRITINDIPDFKSQWPGLLALALIGFFLTCEALYYPLGGWDAWSCWNLKAKFIYLGKEQWRSLFDPVLWRSNTQYPLLLPCITVWFWDLVGTDAAWVPMLNSIVFTVLCAGLLLFALQRSTGQWPLPLILTAAVFLLPFNITLSAGQYSDILLGLFLLCAFVCVLQQETLLAAIFLGLLSFTKPEGMVAAGILAALVLWQNKKQRAAFLTALLLSGLATIIFNLGMAPHNEAFTNGLTSSAKPSTWGRLQAVLVYPLLELGSFKWNGLWMLLLVGLGLKWKSAFGSKLRMFGIFAGLYLAVVLTYYQINTFFEIGWWMQNTLHRILFAILPSLMLWLGLALVI